MAALRAAACAIRCGLAPTPGTFAKDSYKSRWNNEPTASRVARTEHGAKGEQDAKCEDLGADVTPDADGRSELPPGASGNTARRRSTPRLRQQRTASSVAKPLVAQGTGCYACGAYLQCTYPESPGFVPPEKFMLKKKHRQLSSVACTRCQQLAHGKLIAAVGGHGGYRIESIQDVPMITADDLRAQLKHIALKKALILKLVDILDLNGSFISRIRDIVGANPIVLVVTKIDLLPEGTNLDAVGDWVLEILKKKALNVVAVHLTSSKSKLGLSAVAATVHRERQGRDVYVMGVANVGKSTFVSALLDEMAVRDAMAASARRRKPIASAVPGTTLGTIQLKAFSGGGYLFDTPGVHLHHRMAAFLSPPDLKHLSFKRRLRGYTVGTNLNSKTFQSTDDSGLEGSTVFWGGIARVDVLQAPNNASLTFFGPTDIKALRTHLSKAEEFYTAELGKSLTPPTAAHAGPQNWDGLESVQAVSFPLHSPTSRGPLGDVSISGLGWIQVNLTENLDAAEPGRSALADSGVRVEDILSLAPSDRFNASPLQDFLEDSKFETPSHELQTEASGQVTLVIHTPKGVEIFVRPPMPVGLAAETWYEYADLSEEEESKRPMLLYESAKPVG